MALDRVCRKAMALRQQDRPPSADAFAAELEGARTAPPPSFGRRLLKPLGISVGTALVLAAATIGIVRSLPSGPGETPRSHGEPPAPPGDLLREAELRMARGLGGTLNFESAMAALAEAEHLYRQVLLVAPGNVPAGAGLGRPPRAAAGFAGGGPFFLRASDFVISNQ